MIRSITTFNGIKDLKLTFSDQQKMIKKIGTEELYAQAWDVPESTFVYEETDIPIEITAPEEI